MDDGLLISHILNTKQHRKKAPPLRAGLSIKQQIQKSIVAPSSIRFITSGTGAFCTRHTISRCEYCITNALRLVRAEQVGVTDECVRSRIGVCQPSVDKRTGVGAPRQGAVAMNIQRGNRAGLLDLVATVTPPALGVKIICHSSVGADSQSGTGAMIV